MKWLQDRCSFSSLTHNRLKLEETFVLIVVNWMYLDILIIIYLCMSSKAKCTNACCSSNSENPKSNCMTLKNFNRFNTTIWIICTVFSVDRTIIAIIRVADKIFSLKNIWYYRVLLAFVENQIAHKYYSQLLLQSLLFYFQL